MSSHFNLSDEEFAQQFENCSLNPKLFSHEAHLRLGYIHINKYGEAAAITNLCEQIKRFDQTFDDGTKFNVTVTVAAIKVMAHFIGKATGQTFEDLIEEFPRLVTNFADLLHSHYGFNIFEDTRAKKVYIGPDLLAF